ncbi:MAG: AraC family transcriptional regulator [Flavobacterium sp.]|nr:MAG: AraC family transcriptional regulator [Flavobacterium sp.]
MKKATHVPYVFESISDLHRVLELPKPEHPLVSVINMENIKCHFDDNYKSVVYNFYSICIKKNFKGTMKYGQSYYDFDEGTMTFFSPGQVITTIVNEDLELSGYWLILHPDFIRNYTLGKNIKNFGYFSYATNEALHLSEKEEAMITGIMKDIEKEYRSIIDSFSQDVIISHTELLLNYCNRFYNRQFITRKTVNNELLIKLEEILSDYFNGDKVQQLGLPSVQYLAEQLNISSNYLSDMLRNLTGQNAQQHIHSKLIEKAKEILTTTSLSVGEIAFSLGFEHPQSFSKLFKSKTNVSPLAFRGSFN